jgi:hypothetical protein
LSVSTQTTTPPPEDKQPIGRDVWAGIGYGLALVMITIGGVNGAIAAHFVGWWDSLAALLFIIALLTSAGINLFHRSHGWCSKCKSEINTTWTFTSGWWSGGWVDCPKCKHSMVRRGRWLYDR